jgi:hypothetical protein
MVGKKDLYAKPRYISSVDDCNFYHTMEIPGYGTVSGLWDFRGREESYLGHVDLKSKTVLEIGTASGYLCFYMEKQGAIVTAYDVSQEYCWDVVPYAKSDYKQNILRFKEDIDRLNNSFWLAHRLYKSKAKMVYGTVYKIPDNLGEFDICTFGGVLLHLRDPFLALHQASQHIKKTIIVTELPVFPFFSAGKITLFDALFSRRLIRFLPNASTCQPTVTWWSFSPELIIEFIKILGFENTELSYHKQPYKGREVKLYTVVGQRKG